MTQHTRLAVPVSERDHSQGNGVMHRGSWEHEVLLAALQAAIQGA